MRLRPLIVIFMLIPSICFSFDFSLKNLEGDWQFAKEELGSDGHLRKYYSFVRFSENNGVFEGLEISGLEQTLKGKEINRLHFGSHQKDWYNHLGAGCFELIKRVKYQNISLSPMVDSFAKLENSFEHPIRYDEFFSQKERIGPFGEKRAFREFIIFSNKDEFVRVREDLEHVVVRRFTRVE